MIDLETVAAGPVRLLLRLGRNIRKTLEKESTMANMTPGVTEGDNEKVTTVIADDLEIKGTVRFESSLMTRGVIEGEIISQGLLIVGPTAKVSATITTKNLISHGEIHGDVTATDKAVLTKTAVHHGDITTPSIVIEGGSVFNGSCIMQRRPRNLESQTVEVESSPEATTFVPPLLEQATEVPKTEEVPLEAGSVRVESAEMSDAAPEQSSGEVDRTEAYGGDEEKGENTQKAVAYEADEEKRDEAEKTEGIWSFNDGDYPRKPKLF